MDWKKEVNKIAELYSARCCKQAFSVRSREQGPEVASERHKMESSSD